MKQNTLYSTVVNFINSYKIGETYTSEDFCNALNDITRKKNQHKKWNGQFYRIRVYQTYLKSAGFITNVKRGIWRINYHVPDWMSLYALETLRGYKDGYWNGREYVKRPDTFRNELATRLKAYKQRIDKDGVEEVNGLFKRGLCTHLPQEEKAPEQSKTVTCIDKGSYRTLTNGKEYKIIGEDHEYYNIINDNGDEVPMFKSRFTEIKTPQQDTKKTWKIGDTLSADLLNNHPHNFYGYYNESWKTRSKGHFSGDRKIKKIDIVDGRLAALISRTGGIWIEIATIDIPIDKVPQERLSEFLTELEALIAKYK